MINGIGSYNTAINSLQPPARSAPDPEQMFKRVDTDGSGGISQAELETMAQDMSLKTGQSIDTEDAFTTYDADGDGELSNEEMQTFMEASMQQGVGMLRMAGGPPPAQAEDADNVIDQYDTDGDGVLSSAELQAYLDEQSTSSMSLHQMAISAYTANFGSGGQMNLLEDFL